MINSLKNMVSQVLYAPGVQSTETAASSAGSSGNPFVQSPQKSTYAVNKPVKGGYFAGYYNGKPNIVGRRLFIEA